MPSVPVWMGSDATRPDVKECDATGDAIWAIAGPKNMFKNHMLMIVIFATWQESKLTKTFPAKK